METPEGTFEQAPQKFDVVLKGHESEPHPSSTMGFETYEEAVAFEVDWLQRCALHRVDPLSSEGRILAVYARHAEVPTEA